MAITYPTVHGKAQSYNAPVSITGLDTTGCDFFVFALSMYQGSDNGTITISDSKSNTGWTGTTSYASSIAKIRLYYCVPTSVGASHDFTATSTGSAPAWSVAVAGFAGVKQTSPFDQQAGATATSGTSLATGSITPPEDDCLIITAFSGGDGTSSYAASGYTTTDTYNHTPGTAEGIALAYAIQTSAAAANPSWGWTTSGDAAVTVVSFKSAGGGAATGQPTMRRWGGVPHTGTQKLRNGGRGGVWGRTRDGLIVPRRLAA